MDRANGLLALLAALTIILTACTIFSPGQDGSSVSSLPREGMSEDECVAYFTSSARDVPCENVSGVVSQDACYWNLSIIMRYEHEFECYKVACDLINEPVLQYICFRINFRPHMLEFLTVDSLPGDTDITPLHESCEPFDPYSRLFCNYRSIAAQAHKSPAEAERLCTDMQNKNLEGECDFVIASVLAMNISKESGGSIPALLNLCGRVTDDNWRSECYYVLADELALSIPAANLELIASACRQSSSAKDYRCFDHVAMLLPDNLVPEFCSLIEGDNQKDCVWGYGRQLGYGYGVNLSHAHDLCSSFSEGEDQRCLEGWSWGIGNRNSDMRTGVDACMALGGADFRRSCFQGLSGSHVNQFDGDVKSGVAVCREVFPATYQDLCLDDLSRGESRFFRGFTRSECDHFPDPYRENCLATLGERD